MPHRCLNCGKVYEEGAEELLEGCYYKGQQVIDQEEVEEEKEEKEEEKNLSWEKLSRS